MSKKRYDNIIIISIIFFLFLTFTHRYVSADDAAVMALLARSLSPTPSTWTGSNFCKWEGVSCYSNKVTSINLSSKSLSGTIPPQIIQLSNLKFLSLQRNQFSGSLPPLSNHPSLEEINLDCNNFDSIPKGFLSGLTSLQSFSINNNTNLQPWNIPETLKDSTTITSFLASFANIIGQIPDIFDSLQHLQSIKLSYNNMTGSLPKSFAKSSIQSMWLNNVGFSGTLDVLGGMTQLTEAYLQMNKFSGPIPDLSACTELTDLQLRDNILTGVIPDSLTKLPKLTNVALQDNFFQGPMPVFPSSVEVSLGNDNIFCKPDPGPCDPQVTTLLQVVGAMGYPITLIDSWIGNDACENWKFVVCDKGSVTKLSFGKQNWTGTISPAIANLTELKSLLLNDNRLDGVIPTSLTSLKNLEIIDISNNNISGKVPIFASSVTVITTGNVFIGQDVSGSSSSHNESRVSVGTIVVSVIVVIIVSILGFLIYRRCANKRSTKYQRAGECSASGNSGRNLIINVDKTNDDVENAFSSNNGEGTTPSEKSDNYHVYDGGNVTIPVDVLHKATNNFSENNIIGRGGFGVVYKGKLHDGTKIAVKRMESSVINNKGLLEFKAEIEVLTKVKHRSLVALHGFCDNGNERLLVYEYMPQGCLEDHLFDWKVKGVESLSWDKRVTIALDVARGVEYLHSLAQQSFIHRDLKPSNILLGDDMRAKVSDFGLVKSAPDGNYSFETRLAGTFGYLAPEYAATGRVTTKVDVYAFGVILMEIITGRRALDDKLPNEQCHLVTYFRRLLVQKDSIQAVVDSTLRPSMDEKTFQSILKVAELAGHCTAREPHQRPDMSHAVNVLSCLGEKWTPVPDEEESFGVDCQLSLPQAVQKWKANEDSFFGNE